MGVELHGTASLPPHASRAKETGCACMAYMHACIAQARARACCIAYRHACVQYPPPACDMKALRTYATGLLELHHSARKRHANVRPTMLPQCETHTVTVMGFTRSPSLALKACSAFMTTTTRPTLPPPTLNHTCSGPDACKSSFQGRFAYPWPLCLPL